MRFCIAEHIGRGMPVDLRSKTISGYPSRRCAKLGGPLFLKPA